ncbi:molybdopterin oxidoreductase [Cellulomonas sp. ATA003]|nr:molybdopterin oxidoreductase [Cellulomonas sp. ATA003]WNB84973.1 molybdopterin oxidoreductase [Cellulomonas sp. ATA003]
MTHHEGPRPQPQEATTVWWTVGAWASLVLVLAGGLAGAAGLG